MKMSALMDTFLKVASALQDMATYLRPLFGVMLFSLSAAIILFATRYVPKDEGE